MRVLGGHDGPMTLPVRPPFWIAQSNGLRRAQLGRERAARLGLIEVGGDTPSRLERACSGGISPRRASALVACHRRLCKRAVWSTAALCRNDDPGSAGIKRRGMPISSRGSGRTVSPVLQQSRVTTYFRALPTGAGQRAIRAGGRRCGAGSDESGWSRQACSSVSRGSGSARRFAARGAPRASRPQAVHLRLFGGVND
jgi:hypothetical protein